MPVPHEPPIFLDQAEIERLTGRKRRRAQIAQLKAMGIAVIENAAGEPIVSRAAVEQRLGLRGASAGTAEPNWDALKPGRR
jgi:hypothetical protein